MIRRIVVATLILGALYAAAMLHATGGRLSLPLDDSFIYFQYARQAAAGQPFVYQPGDAPTSGATSAPWMLALSVFALLGFAGKAMIPVAMALGGGLLVLTARCAAATQRALAPRKPGSARPGDLPVLGVPLAGALVVLSGPLQWGAWSGMEIALTAAAVAWAGAEWARTGGAPGARVALAGACLATVRPEGTLLALWMPALWALGAARGRWNARSAAWGLLPMAGAALVPLTLWALTGRPTSTGWEAKSLLAAPGADPLAVARVGLLRSVGLARSLLLGAAPFTDGGGLYAYGSKTAGMFLAPGTALLFAIGILPALAREGRERRAGPGVLSAAWIGTWLFATSMIVESDAHFGRYQMPILPVLLPWASIGVGRVARALRDTKAGFSRLADGIRIWLVAFGVVSVAFWGGAFADNAADIDRMQIRFGERLAEELGPDETVAINDAGAIAYVSRRRTLDLIGLTSSGFAGRWTEGGGAMWEELEALPPRERPGWFCIFPNWFELDELGILRRVGGVRLVAPSIVDAEKVLYRADWALAGAGDRPADAIVRVVDRLDVAHVASEQAHAWRLVHRERGAEPPTFVRRGLLAGAEAGAEPTPNPADAGASLRPLTRPVPREILDGGRTVFDEVSFDLARDPDQAADVRVRTLAGYRQRLFVSVDGRDEPAVEVYGPSASARFHEQVVARLPAGTGTSRVRLRVDPRAAASAPLALTHVFAVTRPAE